MVEGFHHVQKFQREEAQRKPRKHTMATSTDYSQSNYGQPTYGQPGGQSGYEPSGAGQRGAGFNKMKTTVAGKLHEAARRLQEQAGGAEAGPDGGMNNLGQRAGAWLERSANYVNDMEPQQLRSDLENQVRRNPGRSLLIAGAVGLLVGRLLRGR